MTDLIDQLFPTVSKPLWADIPFTREEEADCQYYNTYGEGAELNTRILKEIALLRAERATADIFASLNALSVMQPPKRTVRFATSAIVMDPTAASTAATSQTASTNTLILHNIPRDVSEQELRAEFDSYGTIQRIAIPIDKNRKSPHFGGVRGFAIIEYASVAEAEAAMAQENNRLTIRGKKITIEYSKK